MSVFLLGIDLGTSGSKAVLVSEDGRVVGSASHGYSTSRPRPSWSEQAPNEWWAATVKSIRAVMEESDVPPEEIVGVGLTGQMHGLVLLDDKGEVLRPALLWNDQRTGAECEAITKRLGPERVIELTGNPVLPGFTAPKIEWVRQHEPDVFSNTAQVLLPKDYIRYRLTETFATDVSDASGTSLFDVEHRRWSDEMTDALEVPDAWLPEVSESPEVRAQVSREAAEVTGLSEGTPVVGGAGDQAAQAIGTGAVNEGSVVITLGTSGVVFAPSDEYRVDPDGRLHAFCHAVPGQWHLMGVMLSAAGSLQWYHDEMWQAAFGGTASEERYEQLFEAAATVPAGAEGLLFLPYLSGERTPHADPDARGVFFGLHLRHQQKHMARAILEGVAFGLRDSLELMRGLGVVPNDVSVSGGGAQSPLWRQILADVLNVSVVHTTSPHGAALGAALLAGVGAEVYPDVPSASQAVYQEAGRATPMEDVEAYEALYERYQALYPTLAGEFEALSETIRAIEE